jgi:endonuclease YncB( thermonuclease family)
MARLSPVEGRANQVIKGQNLTIRLNLVSTLSNNDWELSMIGNLKKISLTALVVFGYAYPVFAQGELVTVSGQATIVDGDTIEVNAQTVRLHGIDAAESGQRCITPNRKIVRPSVAAIVRLTQLVKDGVTCRGSSFDEFGRLIAVCENKDSTQINDTMVKEGHAWAFVKFSSDYSDSQELARSRGVGIWSARCQEPWVFRQKRWTANVPKAPDKTCLIKGNISENGYIYHMPWQRHYSRTNIDTSKGERWFCNENEARIAGWRKSKT